MSTRITILKLWYTPRIGGASYGCVDSARAVDNNNRQFNNGRKTGGIHRSELLAAKYSL